MTHSLLQEMHVFANNTHHSKQNITAHTYFGNRLCTLHKLKPGNNPISSAATSKRAGSGYVLADIK